MKLRIEEAIEYARAKGKRVFKKDIAQIMYPKAKRQREMLSAYLRDDTVFVKIEWIIGICNLCECPLEILLGIEEPCNVIKVLKDKTNQDIIFFERIKSILDIRINNKKIEANRYEV